MDKKSPQARGGEARAKKLSPERKKEIARKGAESRWSKDLPEAAYEGAIPLGEAEVSCAIVGQDQRIITQATFLRALSRARSPKAGTGVLTTVDEMPFFLSASVFKPFITEDIMASTKPVFYRTKGGGKGVGYDARLLPQVAEVYLRFRDQCLIETGSVPDRYDRMVRAADTIMRGLAHVGIIALVDEATGFQDVRARDALAKILEQFLSSERQKWARTFPLQFYKEIYRLRNWEWQPWNTRRPQVIARWTDNFVYDRLAPGITEELRNRNPTTRPGQRSAKHHQWFNPLDGHPALREHIAGVIALLRNAETWESFKRSLDRVYPKFGETIEMDLPGGGPKKIT